jgi:DNA-binding NtrC family response regulator
MCQAVSRRTILCIGGGDVSARQLVSEALPDYALVFAVSACEAIRSMNARAFDGYVTDFWLPDWEGIQLCRAIREVDPNCPVIVYSAAAGERNIARAMRAGASACVAIDEPDLLETTLRTLLSAADSKSLDAKALMEEAVAAELARCAERSSTAGIAPLADSFIERRARSRAHKAFVAAGGSRAHFERWWPQVFGSARANHGVAFA